MELEDKGILLVVGDCGTGKTEVSVNFALNYSQKGGRVKIADLDLVNPYFRVREVRHFLNKHKIEVILPPEEYLNSDLPILTPKVSGMIENYSGLLILDVGGGTGGSVVLGSLSCYLENNDIHVTHVINFNRPSVRTINRCLNIHKDIENVSKVKITSLVSNSNFIDETNVEDIYRGYSFVSEVSKILNIPVFCATVPIEILPRLDVTRLECPILLIRRRLVPPWVHFK